MKRYCDRRGCFKQHEEQEMLSFSEKAAGLSFIFVVTLTAEKNMWQAKLFAPHTAKTLTPAIFNATQDLNNG